jgi:hypothetical protein
MSLGVSYAPKVAFSGPLAVRVRALKHHFLVAFLIPFQDMVHGIFYVERVLYVPDFRFGALRASTHNYHFCSCDV